MLLGKLDPEAKSRQLKDALRVLYDRMSHQEQKTQALESEGAKTLTALLDHSDKDVKVLACSIVGKFSTLQQGRLAIMEAGAIPLLEKLIHGAGSTLEATIGESLNMFSNMPHGGCQEIEEKALKGIGSHLRHKLTKTGPNGIAARSNVDLLQCIERVVLATRSDRLLGTEFIHQCVKVLNHASASQPENLDITNALLGALRALGMFYQKGRQEILEKDNLSVLIKCLALPDPRCRETAVSLLAVLSLELNGKKGLIGASLRLWQLYIGNDETDYCKKMAMQTIRTAQEWQPFRTDFVDVVLSNEGTEAFGQLDEILGIHLIRAVYPVVKEREVDKNPLLHICLKAIRFCTDFDDIRYKDEISNVPKSAPDSIAAYMWETLPDLLPFLVGILENLQVSTEIKKDAEFILLYVIAKDQRAAEQFKTPINSISLKDKIDRLTT